MSSNEKAFSLSPSLTRLIRHPYSSKHHHVVKITEEEAVRRPASVPPPYPLARLQLALVQWTVESYCCLGVYLPELAD